LRRYSGDSIIRGGDEDKIGSVNHFLIVFEHGAAINSLCQIFGRVSASTRYAYHLVALTAQQNRQGSAHGSGSDKTQLKHFTSY
jgi:hypothetical protein